jgi:hypothetical protein
MKIIYLYRLTAIVDFGKKNARSNHPIGVLLGGSWSFLTNVIKIQQN